MVVPGDTLMEGPVAKNVPPQLPVYHFQLAPVPSVPPVTLRVVEPPAQIVGLTADAVGVVELDCPVTSTEVQVVVLQVPCALT